MGIYINPTNGDAKENWLAAKGKRITVIDATDGYKALRAEGNVPVVLVDNGIFTAAGVCYCEQEAKDFGKPDGRPKMWFSVPVASLDHTSGVHPKEVELINRG